MPIHFKKVTNNIYRGGEPSEKDLFILSKHGINKIISLDGDIGYKIHPLVKQLNMQHIIIPLSGKESLPLMRFVKDNIMDLLIGKVYIHCKLGSDRTGFAIMLYRLNTGYTFDQALKEAKKFGFGKHISKEITSLYLDIIKSTQLDKNDILDDYDMSLMVREDLDNSSNKNVFEPQQSFAPYMSVIDKSDLPISEEKTLMDITQELGNITDFSSNDEIKFTTKVPDSGSFNESGTIIGVGPIEPILYRSF